MAVGDGAKIAVNSYIAVGKESAWGTYASATTAVEALSCSFKTEIDSMKLDQIGGNRGFSHRVTLGRKVGGSLEQYLHPQESVLMVANALGGHIVTSSTTTSANVHSLTAGNFDTTPSIGLSFNVRKGETHVWRYSGGRVNTMKITGKVGEPIQASYEFLFKDSTQLTDDIASTLSISSVRPFTFVGGVFRYSSTEVLAATTTAQEPIQSFELSIKNNIKSDSDARSLGTALVDVLPPTRREVELKIQNRFDTTTTYSRFIQATQGSVELYFTGDYISGTAGPVYAMTIRLPKVFNKTGDTEISGPGDILKTDIEFDCLLDAPGITTTTRDIGVTFVNNTAAY